MVGGLIQNGTLHISVVIHTTSISYNVDSYARNYPATWTRLK